MAEAGRPKNAALAFLAVSVLAFLARLPFILIFPTTGGDADIYSTVAQNILSGCGVSLSDPASGACVPHFGGNQGPGYPFFMAAVWFLSNHSDMAVRLVQAAALAGAIGWAAYAFAGLLESRGAGIVLGIVLALSPLQLAWSRYLVTEALSLAATIGFFAVVLLSIRDNRLRVVALGVVLAVATFIRLDLVTLTIPVAVLAFALHQPRTALARGTAIALILTLPWAAWTARNVAVGLHRLYPTPMTMPDGKRPPLGYASWVRTWLVHEYERPGALFGPNRFDYKDIYIPPRAYNTAAEKLEVAKLLDGLKAHQGEAIPEAIDDGFAKLAAERRARYPLQYYVINPTIRSFELWANPLSSFGWPDELPSMSDKERLAIVQGGLRGKLALAARYPFRALAKAVTGLYRFGLLAAFLLGCLYAVFAARDRRLRVLTLTMFSFFAGRTLLLAFIGNVETRYTVQVAPAMEIVVVALAWYWWTRRQKPG
jgi:Dolichyl-phosphate-mannose-protein mannosyltransferase